MFFGRLWLAQAFSEELNQSAFGKKFGLRPCIYFFHYAFERAAAVPDLLKLNYKCSSHEDFRIRASCGSCMWKFR